MVGLSVETSSFAAYPSVLRLVEHCHRHHHVGPRPPAALLKKRARRPMHIDTDHARAFLMAEVGYKALRDGSHSWHDRQISVSSC
jgi:hypothetical protein